jgi:glycine/D-amino acid oxidase-like deaminating enzyme/nitrite reductase/ring-hydroxylating ferredoxin subunit
MSRAGTGTGITVSPWMERVPASPDAKPFASQPVPRDARVDVCVVGGGIAGLTTAYLLAGEGKRVALLERGEIGGGESARTTAHLTCALDDRYHHLIATRGLDVARIAAESHDEAIDAIEEIARAEGIECDFERVDGHLFLPPNQSRDRLEEELEATHKVGLVDVTLLERCPSPLEALGPCLRFPRQGQFHILKYLRGLAQAAVRRGAVLCENAAVVDIGGEGPYRVETADSGSLRANHVVHATNAPLGAPEEITLKEFAYRTYVVALPVPPGRGPVGLYWDDDMPYHYVRAMADPSRAGETLVLVGGEDHKTGQADDGEERFVRLERWARERFPDAGPVRYRWSGQVFETIDGLALVGPYPGRPPGQSIITGDSGMGMTHGTIGALLLRDLVIGRANPWAEAFDPRRRPLQTALHAVAELAPNALHLVAQKLEGGHGDPSDLAPGEGRVIRENGQPVAIYRDETGALVRRSAACTHQGCVVKWNSTELSWDCPCHGSRFDREGRVLAGPASDDLAAPEVSSHEPTRGRP